jgi:hypothetical protein
LRSAARPSRSPCTRSSAERDVVEIAVKALGDFSSPVHEPDPGTTA